MLFLSAEMSVGLKTRGLQTMPPSERVRFPLCPVILYPGPCPTTHAPYPFSIVPNSPLWMASEQLVIAELLLRSSTVVPPGLLLVSPLALIASIRLQSGLASVLDPTRVLLRACVLEVGPVPVSCVSFRLDPIESLVGNHRTKATEVDAGVRSLALLFCWTTAVSTFRHECRSLLPLCTVCSHVVPMLPLIAAALSLGSVSLVSHGVSSR